MINSQRNDIQGGGDSVSSEPRDGRVSRTVFEWSETNSFREIRWPVRDILCLKQDSGISVTLILPARNVRRTIQPILEQVGYHSSSACRLVDQVLVVDADSTDGTPEIARSLGAEVWSESELLPTLGPVLGKGDAMWRSLGKARCDLVLFADTDTIGFELDLLCGILGPLLSVPSIQFVKAAYTRPFFIGGQYFPGEGGRVTELTAKPLFNLFFPELTGFVQPLAGEFGCTRRILEAVPFVTGYGVEAALLIDILRLVGLPAMAQVYVGSRQNQHQPLHDLSRMSFAVARTILQRAVATGKICVDSGFSLVGEDSPSSTYLQAGITRGMVAVSESEEILVERPALSEL